MSTSESFFVRPAIKDDMGAVMKMIQELAEFEGYPIGPKITEKDLIRDGFESISPKFICYVAECRETKQLVGHIFGNYAYSSWTGVALYIEDLYVKEPYRSKKVGHLLLKEYCKLAKEKGCSRIDWHVLMENSSALKFYISHGAFCLEDREKRACYRLIKNDIHRVADEE